MRKKYLSALLFGALLFASAGTFTSCKDYDDDINSLQEQINTIASSLEDIKAQIGDKGVTSVTVEGGKLIVVTNGQTVSYDLPSGVDVEEIEIKDGHLYVGGVDKGAIGGTNGSIVTVNEDGVLMIDGKEAGLKVGTEVIIKDASNGVYTISINGETIQLPMASAGLVSISPLGDDVNHTANIYYGLLTKDVEWDGAKAVDGKMVAGMYPVLEKDINVMLNPTGVDGTAYSYEFRDSENETPWGLKLGEASVYAGDKLTVGNLSRATVSPSGVWTISRYLDYVPTKDLDERADYVTQFKQNDGNYYAFALQANDKNSDAEGIKSQYLYSFNPMNVNSLTGNDFNWVYSEKNTYKYGVEHTPNFEGYAYKAPEGSIYGEGFDLSDVIYDYKLSIDKNKMTQVKIDEYGLKISEDKHSFIAANAQAVNNKIYLVVDYILINGQKGQLTVDYTIVNSDIEVIENSVDLGTSAFNATLIEAAKAPFTQLNNRYVDAKSVNFDPKSVFGDNYDQWIDAMYNSMYNPHSPMTDDEKANFLNYQATIVGGNPINNATYNNGLVRNFIYFDYVDAEGKSCIYGVKSGEELTRLQAIAGLKVYFIAGTYMNGSINQIPVKTPYYTISGNDDWTNGYAMPLDNAFRVEVATTKQEQTIAKYNFTFELTMPNCPIERKTVGNQTTAWSTENGIDVLKIYGEKLDDKQLAGDLRDAFTGAFQYFNGAYNGKMNVEANWYEAQIPLDNLTMTILGKQRGETVTLSEIANSSEYNKWNTIGMYGAGSLDEAKLVNVKYHHFGVYTEEQGDIILKFASKVKDSQKATVKSAGTEANPFIAKAVYDEETKELDHYEFSVSNNDFTMTDAFGNAYYLFDNDKVYRANLHVKLLEDRQGIVTDKNEPSFYGLYPSAKVDGATTDLVTFKLDKGGVTDYTTKMTMEINKSAGVDKVIEITYNVTDVFGCVKPVTFYVRTVNEAIGNDDK